MGIFTQQSYLTSLLQRLEADEDEGIEDVPAISLQLEQILRFMVRLAGFISPLHSPNSTSPLDPLDLKSCSHHDPTWCS